MKRHATNSMKPQFDRLEERQVLSTAAWVQDGTLYVQGDEFSNNVDVRIFHDIAVVQAENGYYESFIMEQISSVVANLGDGADVLKLDSEYGSWNGDRLTVHIDTGAGDDNVELFGNSEFMRQGDDLAVTMRTLSGADHVEVYLRKMENAAVNLDIDMGTDHDVLTASLAGDLVNADVSMLVRAAKGADRMSFAADMDLVDFGSDLRIDAASSLNVRLLAEQGRDSVDMRMDAVMNGNVTLYGHGGEGPDILTADVTRTTHDAGDVSIDLLGAKGDDTLTLNYQQRLSGTVPIEMLDQIDWSAGRGASATMGFAGGLGLLHPEIIRPIEVAQPFNPIAIETGIELFPYAYDARIDGGIGYDKYSATQNVLVTNCEAPIQSIGDILEGIDWYDLFLQK